MKTAFRTLPFTGFTLAAALGLAACSEKPADPAPLDPGVTLDEGSNAAYQAPPPVAEAPAPAPARQDAEDNADALSPDSIDQSPQIADDADASGMTARLPDNSDSGAPVGK